jgi:hypothetical protein
MAMQGKWEGGKRKEGKKGKREKGNQSRNRQHRAEHHAIAVDRCRNAGRIHHDRERASKE